MLKLLYILLITLVINIVKKKGRILMRCPGRLVKGVFFYPHVKHYGRKAWDPNEPNYKNRLTDIEKRLLVARGRVVGEGWTRSLGLADSNWYI